MVSPLSESGLTTCAATRSPFREEAALSGEFNCAVMVTSWASATVVPATSAAKTRRFTSFVKTRQDMVVLLFEAETEGSTGLIEFYRCAAPGCNSINTDISGWCPCVQDRLGISRRPAQSHVKRGRRRRHRP